MYFVHVCVCRYGWGLMRSNIPTQASSEVHVCAFLACLLTSNAIQTFFYPLTPQKDFCVDPMRTPSCEFLVFDCVRLMHTDAHAKMSLQAKKMFLIMSQLYLVCAHTIVMLFFRVHTYLRGGCLWGGRLRNLRRYVCVCACVYPKINAQYWILVNISQLSFF